MERSTGSKTTASKNRINISVYFNFFTDVMYMFYFATAEQTYTERRKYALRNKEKDNYGKHKKT